jgi:hypothetical protein
MKSEANNKKKMGFFTDGKKLNNVLLNNHESKKSKEKLGNKITTYQNYGFEQKQ